MPGRSHFNLFNKDTRDKIYIVYNVHVPVNHVRYLLLLLIIYCCCSFILFVVRFLIHLYLTFRFLLILLFSLFIVPLFKRKRFNSDPGLYSRYFNPAVPVVQEYHHHLCKSIKIIHQTAPTLS
jgi:small-conductance mechanosensitive channel